MGKGKGKAGPTLREGAWGAGEWQPREKARPALGLSHRRDPPGSGWDLSEGLVTRAEKLRLVILREVLGEPQGLE